MNSLRITTLWKKVFDLRIEAMGGRRGRRYIAFFCSPDDAKGAMTLHRNTMAQRYIELFISNNDEHGRAHGRAQAREPPLEE